MSRRRRSLKELACDPRFISGIHNYCDRWCERCPLTSRCLGYAVEQQDAGDPVKKTVRRLDGIHADAHAGVTRILYS